MTPLFLDTSIRMEKVASSTKLEEDPDRWPMEILKVAYKNLPSLRGYEADVEIDRVDNARGYAVGKMLLYPTGITKQAASGANKLISVPVIVRDHELAPMDVYSYKGEMFPMDERDLQEIMIRSETFGKVAPRDGFNGTNIGEMVTPPNSAHQSGGGHGSGVIKEAAVVRRAQVRTEDTRTLPELLQEQSRAESEGAPSASLSELKRLIAAKRVRVTHDPYQDFDITSEKTASLLNAAVRASDADIRAQVMGEISSSVGLKHAFQTYPSLQNLLVSSDGYQEKTAEAIREERLETLKPSVVQLSYENGEFLIKTANHNCWLPQMQKISRFDAQKALSPAGFGQLLSRGWVTLSVEPTAEPETVKSASIVDRVGIYKMWSGGGEVTGVTVPAMFTLDGMDMEKQLFVNVGRHAMQEKIAGVHLQQTTIPDPEPRGLGCFVYQEGERGFAYEPIEVQNKVVHPEGEWFLCKRASNGEELALHPSPAVSTMTKVAEGAYLLPTSLKWLPLTNHSVKVNFEPSVIDHFNNEKLASRVQSIEVHKKGDRYSFTGPQAGLTEGLTYSDSEAEFMLAGFGVAGKSSRDLLKTAQVRGSARVSHTRNIVTEEEKSLEHVKTASASSFRFDRLPRCNTIKEAALLASPKAEEFFKTAGVALPKESLDAILSLNFMTPENASIYLNYLPVLEKTSSILAELLVASRLGMDDIREAAAKNAMTQVNAVIRGLEQMGEKTQ